MSPDQLDTIIAGSKEEYPKIVGELHQHILDAASAVLEETQESEKTPRLPISVKLTLDLSKAPPTWQMEASVGVRRVARGDSHYLDREETPELPWSEARNN